MVTARLTQGAIMYMATDKPFTHSQDAVLAERFENYLNNNTEMTENDKFAFREYVTYKSLHDCYAPHVTTEMKYHSVAQGLGCLLMNGSLYDHSHEDYTHYDKYIREIKELFKDVVQIKAICTLFLNPNRSEKDTFYKIRDLTWASCADWAK